jgi:hypothetical protein
MLFAMYQGGGGGPIFNRRFDTACNRNMGVTGLPRAFSYKYIQPTQMAMLHLCALRGNMIFGVERGVHRGFIK